MISEAGDLWGLSPQVPRRQPGSGKLLQEGKTPGRGQQLGAGAESQGLLYCGK